MPIKVQFRGPMLFVTDNAPQAGVDDVVDRVLIPDAATAGTHKDGSSAKPHFAGMLVITGGKSEHLSLTGHTVEIIADGQAGLPVITPSFRSVPPIHEMTRPATTNAPPLRRLGGTQSVTATVTFKGGQMSGGMVSLDGFKLPTHKGAPVQKPVASMPVWSSDAASGTIRVTKGDGSVTDVKLKDDVTVFVFNWDVAKPTAEQLLETVVSSETPEDEDFKWVYNLLTPDQNKTWEEWLDGEPLPVPLFIMDEKGLTPPLSTCNSAWSMAMTPKQ